MIISSCSLHITHVCHSAGSPGQRCCQCGLRCCGLRPRRRHFSQHARLSPFCGKPCESARSQRCRGLRPFVGRSASAWPQATHRGPISSYIEERKLVGEQSRSAEAPTDGVALSSTSPTAAGTESIYSDRACTAESQLRARRGDTYCEPSRSGRVFSKKLDEHTHKVRYRKPQTRSDTTS